MEAPCRFAVAAAARPEQNLSREEPARRKHYFTLRPADHFSAFGEESSALGCVFEIPDFDSHASLATAFSLDGREAIDDVELVLGEIDADDGREINRGGSRRVG